MEPLQSPSLPSPCSHGKEPKFQNRSSPYSATRLWRPAAQRNIRNQWSRLLSHKNQWTSASSNGRSHATHLVNAHLSERYMPSMDLGVLSEMPGIRQKACEKLVLQQELYRSKLLSSYKDMVVVVTHMMIVSSSMRCFFKGTAGSPLVQFCSQAENQNDTGDGGGIPVFTFWSIPYIETLAQELVQMFVLELSLKRLLVVELLSISSKETVQGKISRLRWSDELYPGEFNGLCAIGLYSEESFQPVPPRISGWKSDDSMTKRSNHLPDREVLQVYLTAWLAEVNINTHRIDEIFALMEGEMQVVLS